MRKCQKFPLKLVEKSAMIAAILKNHVFYSASGCPYFPNRKQFPKTGLLTLLRLLWMMSFVCRCRRAFFAFIYKFAIGRYTDNRTNCPLLGLFRSFSSSAANSTHYKSFRVELKMANLKRTCRGKSRAIISFF